MTMQYVAPGPRNSGFLTLGDLSRRFGLPVWKIRRVYERGLIGPAMRAGAYRIVREDELPALEAVLRAVGYLPTKAVEELDEVVA